MRQRVFLTSGALLFCCGTAAATDGYFSDGYGMQAAGRGGTSMAISTDSFGGANNPATMAMAGNRLDIGLTLFSPRRQATRSGLGPGLDGSVTSDKNLFEIPEFGYNHMLNSKLALGISMVGNGGMNTTYPGGQFNCGQGPANMLCGSGKLGVDLEQLIIAPTAAYAFTPDQSLGVSPQLAYQRFAATGLHAFSGTPGLSAQPGNVTNNGYDNSYGAGIRIGYFARLSPNFFLGASYASKIRMSRFKDYAGLFAEGGRFDIPESYSVGATWLPVKPLSLSVDYERINYSGVPSIANPSLVAAQLGSSSGPGFGWTDINVWKFGVEYASSDRWIWRAGWNHTGNPVQSANVTFNILAPGVIINHATLGFTYRTSSGDEVTVAYTHAFGNSVQGASILPAFMGGMPAGNERISMHQNSIGVGYAWR